MKYSFEKIIPLDSLIEYVDLWEANTDDSILAFNNLNEEFEEILIPQLSARQFIDFIKVGYSLAEKKYTDKMTRFKLIFGLKYWRGFQRSVRLKSHYPGLSDNRFIDFSKDEEKELLNFLFSVKWEMRDSYDLMNGVHDFIKSLFGYNLPYSHQTDLLSGQAKNKEDFVAKSMALIK